MTISIYKDGLYIKTIQGEVEQCMLNVGIDETWKEVLAFPSSECNKLVNTEKIQKMIAVSNIDVVYNEVVYQGDEISQDRISRTINSLPDDVSLINWKAKDNSSNLLTKSDLKQILYLAGQEQTRILFS